MTIEEIYEKLCDIANDFWDEEKEVYIETTEDFDGNEYYILEELIKFLNENNIIYKYIFEEVIEGEFISIAYKDCNNNIGLFTVLVEE